MNAVPGSPFLGDKPLPPKVIENLTKKYGLDQPLYVQYLTYGKNIILKGDFGQSIKKIGQQVSDIIGRSFPVSARLGLVSVAFATTLGTLLGITGALKRNTMTDRTVMFISTLGIAVPGFVVATSSIILFAVLIKIFPTYGLTSPLHYVLPGLALSFQPLSYITRLTRSTMLDVLNQDYIRTARAKGLKEQKVIFKHALRNAILPVVTYLGPLIAGIITGTFVIEKIFAIPGLGRYFVDSITNRDYPVILGTTIFFGAILILMNLLVDIVYVIVNPQIKLEN
jgi:ABC-type dipeptide/oligopeptide/nickel transport system permease component